MQGTTSLRGTRGKKFKGARAKKFKGYKGQEVQGVQGARSSRVYKGQEDQGARWFKRIVVKNRDDPKNVRIRQMKPLLVKDLNRFCLFSTAYS